MRKVVVVFFKDPLYPCAGRHILLSDVIGVIIYFPGSTKVCGTIVMDDELIVILNNKIP